MSNYVVLRYNPKMDYHSVRNDSADNDSYYTEEEARENMLETARSFVDTLKKEKKLIDIQRPYSNTVRIEYVDKSGKETFIIFQVMKV